MSRSAEAPPAPSLEETVDQRVLRIAFGDREVVVRSHDGEVFDALARIFAMMRAPASCQTVGELEVCREDGHYAVRGNECAILKDPSLASVVRRVQYAAIRRLVDARPDLLWLHAGAAAFGGQAVLFPGPRGGGKSTLVTSLCARGWSYLSDDIVPLDPSCHVAFPFPQAPAVREYPGQEMPPKWLRKPTKAERRLRPDSLCREPTPVAAVVRVSYRRDAGVELSVSSPATTALHLLEQCWNFASHREAAVGSVCALAQHVPGFSVSFSDGEAAADLVARELEARL